MHTITIGHGEVSGLHEGNAMLIAVVIDVFQLLQNLGALLTAIRIWLSKWVWGISNYSTSTIREQGQYRVLQQALHVCELKHSRS